MIRVSVSDLEAYRRFREDEDFPLAVLLRQLRREEGPSEAMQAGTALHSLIERADVATLERAEVDGYTFRFVCDAEIPLRPIRELRGRREYVVGGETVVVTGRVDGFDGITVDDHKLSRQFDAQRYHDSYQWRAYLSIFGARVFRYNIFIGEAIGEKDWEVRDFHALTFYWYPELEADLRNELEMYVDFARQHLPEAIAA